MAFRFQKRISILPGVRINLSKSGASASLGPRGADVNIGRDGVTANAGIPGTGLSYRQKLGGKAKGGFLGVLAIIGGLGVWAFQHAGKIEKAVAPMKSATISTERPTGLSTGPSTGEASTSLSLVNTSGNMLRYVHRKNSILRVEPKASGDILKSELKGATVTLDSQTDDGWSKVTDGNVTGYMRSSVLGVEPPQ
ncbi:MAG TPA: DUF4236 domain-containing protein [Rhizomicrobium sp.]|jgi:hypothetical protein